MRLAKSGDVDFLQRIEKSNFNGFVHSIFDKTINIQCLEDGELYTIASNKLDNGPNSLVIDGASFKDSGIVVNDIVYADHCALHIKNKLSIDVRAAGKWESRLPIYPENVDFLKENLAKMKRLIDTDGKSGGMMRDLTSNNLFENEMSNMLMERSSTLLNALSNNLSPHALISAVGLIGLGPGLTPSGDDFLVGLMITFHLPKSPSQRLQVLGEQIVSHAKSLTNEISYMALKTASQGRVRESINSLMDSLVNGSELELFQSVKNVLNIGSSSGTDIALGIVAGMEINLKLGGRTWLSKL